MFIVSATSHPRTPYMSV